MTLTTPKRLIGKRGVGERYGGKHPRTIERWKQAGILPPPDTVIAGRDYWYKDNLDRHDRQRVAELAERKLQKTTAS